MLCEEEGSVSESEGVEHEQDAESENSDTPENDISGVPDLRHSKRETQAAGHIGESCICQGLVGGNVEGCKDLYFESFFKGSEREERKKKKRKK